MKSESRNKTRTDAQKLPHATISLVVEAAPNAIVMADADGTILLVNAQAEELFGYSRAELLGKKVGMLIPQQLRSHHKDVRRVYFHDPLPRAMGAGRDLYGLRKDGTEVPIEIGLNPVKTADGLLVLASIIDITKRKQAEDELRRERNLLRTLIDNLPDYIYVKDIQRRFLTANTAVARLMGVQSPDELIGKRDEDFYPERASKEFHADEVKVLWGQPLINKSEPNTDKHGRRTEILTTKLSLHDTTGRIIGLVGISRDITDLKNTEKALQDAMVEQEKLISQLEDALKQVKTLQGLLPICSFCHKIRGADGKWERLESYISTRTEADFTHSFCPECAEKHYGLKPSPETRPTN